LGDPPIVRELRRMAKKTGHIPKLYFGETSLSEGLLTGQRKIINAQVAEARRIEIRGQGLEAFADESADRRRTGTRLNVWILIVTELTAFLALGPLVAAIRALHP